MSSCDQPREHQFMGSVTVGERGQIVIPAEARRRLGINTGDKLLVIGHGLSHGLFLCRVDIVQSVLEKFAEGLSGIESNESDESDESAA